MRLLDSDTCLEFDRKLKDFCDIYTLKPVFSDLLHFGDNQKSFKKFVTKVHITKFTKESKSSKLSKKQRCIIKKMSMSSINIKTHHSATKKRTDFGRKSKFSSLLGKLQVKVK